jgi:hypothetical protein
MDLPSRGSNGVDNLQGTQAIHSAGSEKFFPLVNSSVLIHSTIYCIVQRRMQ